jgi:hypothetical protein
MSLTSFIKRKDVQERFRIVRPKFPRKIAAPIRVLPHRDRSHIAGTAFDYLLRMDLMRRAPWAVCEHWVAENAAVTFFVDSPDEKTLSKRFPGKSLQALMHQMEETARQIVTEAQRDCDTYYSLSNPTLADVRRMARHSIRLAHAEVIFRAGLNNVDQEFFREPDVADVQELVELLEVVPFDQLTHSTLLLNPTFGEASRLISGADADLIVGESLIDIKTTRRGECMSTWLDQLFGYYLLARIERARTGKFPFISRIGFYLSRYGHLWLLPASLWTSHPDFDATERWFRETIGATEIWFRDAEAARGHVLRVSAVRAGTPVYALDEEPISAAALPLLKARGGLAAVSPRLPPPLPPQLQFPQRPRMSHPFRALGRSVRNWWTKWLT